MKKLMIVFAAAAMIGAASAKCKPGATEYDATVYSVKISLKTPKGELCGGKTASGSACAPGVNGYVRTPSTYALQGYFANCSESCDILQKFTQNDIALWNTREKLFLTTPTYTVDFIHVLSKSQKNAEIKFSLKGMMDKKGGSTLKRYFELVAAGFGKYSPSAEIFTSFSGNVVGTVSKVNYPKAVNVGTAAAPVWTCPEAGYWLCTTDNNVCGSEVKTQPSVAYGTFAIKYNASASKKMAAGTRPFVSIPDYVDVPTSWK